MFFLIDIFETGYAYYCPVETGQACVAPGGGVFILDTSIDLTDSLIVQQFEYVRRSIFPYLPTYNVSIALMSYGTGDTSTNPYSSNVTETCIMLNTLQNSYASQGRYNVTMLKALKIYEVVYYEDDRVLYDGTPFPVFLFTATQNTNDILASASFIRKRVPDVDFNIISFNNSDLLRSLNFPANIIYSFDDLTKQKTDFKSCMVALMCGYLKNCDASGSTVFFTTPKMTQPITTTTSIPSTVGVVTPASPTSNSGSGGDGTKAKGYCECETYKVWNDVIYIVESSDATLKTGFGDMVSYIQTVSQFFNIQKNGYTGTDNHMRFGLITYSKTAQVVSALGSLDNTGVFNLDIPFVDTDDIPDLEGAINLAVEQFTLNTDRASSRKVIVLLASSYDPFGSRSPQVVMNDFHADGGISIVLDYYESVAGEPTYLNKLASPGYYFLSTESMIPDMLQAQCDANCFCKINYVYLPEGIRVLPTQGCDYPVDIPASYQLAERNCNRNYGDAHLSVTKTNEKQNFALNLTFQSHFIGLSLNSGVWMWDDQTSLAFTPYQNWATPPTNNPNDGGCAVFELTTGKWQQANCKSPNLYICEKNPCSSTNYCNTLSD